MLLFSLGKKEAVDSLICRIWGAPKCHKRPEQELFVLSGGIHGAASPRGAESTRAQAAGCDLSTSPSPSPPLGWRAGFSQESRTLGWMLPERQSFLRGLGPRGAAALTLRGPERPGFPGLGGRGGRSPSLKSRPPGRAPVPTARLLQRSLASCTHRRGLWGGRVKGARERQRQRALARKKQESSPRASRVTATE